jgi:hypothetical protein
MTKKLKVPKRIAGVKIPKKLRKGAKKALDNPVGLELAAAALTAAAAALRERGSAGDGAQAAKGESPKLSDVVISAALKGARKLLDSIDAPETAAAPGPEKPKRKRRVSGGPAASGPPGG